MYVGPEDCHERELPYINQCGAETHANKVWSKATDDAETRREIVVPVILTGRVPGQWIGPVGLIDEK